MEQTDTRINPFRDLASPCSYGNTCIHMVSLSLSLSLSLSPPNRGDGSNGPSSSSSGPPPGPPLDPVGLSGAQWGPVGPSGFSLGRYTLLFVVKPPPPLPGVRGAQSKGGGVLHRYGRFRKSARKNTWIFFPGAARPKICFFLCKKP